MKPHHVLFSLLFVTLGVLASSAVMQPVAHTTQNSGEAAMPSPTTVALMTGFNYGDPLPDAPELAPRGPYRVGVRTLTVTHPDQVDVVRRRQGEAEARYDRPLTLEIWYPAEVGSGQIELTTYQDVLPATDTEPALPFSFSGRALDDATPDASGGPYPLVIVAHGYPGSRVQMTYLTENLASKGYVVVAIDHTESTFADQDAFQSTLYHRPLDIRFTLDTLAAMHTDDTFLRGLVDADRTGIIGYSMGGYGALNAAGAGYNRVLQGFAGDFTAPLLADDPAYQAAQDDRIRAVVAVAPFGGDLQAAGAPGLSFWDDAGLAGLRVPTLFAVGTLDDVSQYETGVRRLYEQTVNSDRYLLIFENARHNIGSNPPPPEATAYTNYERYSEPAWDKRRINNIMQHFVTAFLGIQLQGREEYRRYLAVATEPGESAPIAGADWIGFPARAAVGLRLEHTPPVDQG